MINLSAEKYYPLQITHGYLFFLILLNNADDRVFFRFSDVFYNKFIFYVEYKNEKSFIKVLNPIYQCNIDTGVYGGGYATSVKSV